MIKDINNRNVFKRIRDISKIAGKLLCQVLDMTTRYANYEKVVTIRCHKNKNYLRTSKV